LGFFGGLAGFFGSVPPALLEATWWQCHIE
jgi:hypothetical protein